MEENETIEESVQKVDWCPLQGLQRSDVQSIDSLVSLVTVTASDSTSVTSTYELPVCSRPVSPLCVLQPLPDEAWRLGHYGHRGASLGRHTITVSDGH